MEANTHPTYEEAVRNYLSKLNALIEWPHGVAPIASPSSGETIAAPFIRLAEEISEISVGMILSSQKYQSSSDPLIQEGLCCHLIDQATTELLLETGLMQIMQEEETGIPPAAALQANFSAALREAINAAEKSLVRPVERGIAIGDSYRITEGSSIAEAAFAFKAALACTAGGIFRRVQEFGSDIAIDLISETEWTTVLDGALSLRSPAERFLESAKKEDQPLVARAAFAARRTLRNVYEKVAVLSNTTPEFDARKKIWEWLEKIRQTEKVELFGALIESLYGLEELIKSMERRFEDRTSSPELINSASDLTKTYSDKFIVLTGRMRKLEDAIRLGKLIQLPPLIPTLIALQAELLAALVSAGYRYIRRCENASRLWNIGDCPR